MARVLRKTLPLAEYLGQVPAAVFGYLEGRREEDIEGIAEGTSLSRTECVRGLSILVLHQLVNFTYSRGYRYFVDSKMIQAKMNDPVILRYIDRTYGPEGMEAGLELITSRSVGAEREVVRAMALEGIIEEEKARREKKVKESEGREKKRFVLNRKKVGEKIIREMVAADIERKYTRQTRAVFSVLLHAHPNPMPLKSVLQRGGESLVLGSDLGGFGFVEGFDEDAGVITPEQAVKGHLDYLVADGAVLEVVGKYRVDMEALKERCKMGRIVEYIERFHGPRHIRVFSAVSSRGLVEDRSIDNLVLLDKPAARVLLMELYSGGLIDTQVIPRSSECSATKSFHLWRFDRRLVEKNVAKKVFSMIQERCWVLEKREETGERGRIYADLEALHVIYFAVTH
jgi:hypothetical protein